MTGFFVPNVDIHIWPPLRSMFGSVDVEGRNRTDFVECALASPAADPENQRKHS